jgi:hypothetical protein
MAKKAIHLDRIRDGKSLGSFISRAEATLIDNPPLSPTDSEHQKSFLQDVTDFVDIWNDMSITQKLDAAKNFDNQISVLEELGINIYANIVPKPMQSATGPWELQVLVIFLNPTDADHALTHVDIDGVAGF